MLIILRNIEQLKRLKKRKEQLFSAGRAPTEHCAEIFFGCPQRERTSCSPPRSIYGKAPFLAKPSSLCYACPMKRYLWIPALALGCLFALGCTGEKKILQEAAALYTAGDYAAAISVLEGLTENEDALALMADCAAALDQQAYDAALGALEAGDYGVARTAFLQLGDYLDAPQQAENARLAALGEQVKGLAERIRLLSGEPAAFLENLPQLAAEAEALGEHPAAEGMFLALTALSKGDGPAFFKAVEGMEEALFTSEDWLGMLSACLVHSQEDGDRALSLLWAWNMLLPSAAGEMPQSQKEPLHGAAWDALERAGRAPAGKVLIYATRRHYASQDRAYYDLERMQGIPGEHTAENPEEASYVIHIAYDYKRVGRFTTYYNRGVLEFADVTLIDAATGKKVGAVQEVRGPTAKSLETAKITSEFVSGGPPDEGEIDLAVDAALERALGLLAGGAE